MTPTEKLRELLKEFSREKALDIVETMECFAIELDEENILFWKAVKSLILKDDYKDQLSLSADAIIEKEYPIGGYAPGNLNARTKDAIRSRISQLEFLAK